MILGFADYEQQGRRLAEALGEPFAQVELHRFPDGESRLTLPPRLPKRVIVCRSLDRPNDKLIELLLLAETARAMGVEELFLAAPYLCYLRQDIAFHPGEAVSARIVGRFIAGLFDAVLTVDPHLHRITRLEEALPGIRAVTLSATPAMSAFLQGREHTPMLVGPDAESAQWVKAIAKPAGLDYAVASKERYGDRQVKVTLPQQDYRGREIVLVDDMASTGRTLMAVAGELKRAGAGRIHCLVTHALFADKVTEQLKQAGIEAIWSSDSISHDSNAIALAPLLAATLREL